MSESSNSPIFISHVLPTLTLDVPLLPARSVYVITQFICPFVSPIRTVRVELYEVAPLAPNVNPKLPHVTAGDKMGSDANDVKESVSPVFARDVLRALFEDKQ